MKSDESNPASGLLFVVSLLIGWLVGWLVGFFGFGDGEKFGCLGQRMHILYMVYGKHTMN